MQPPRTKRQREIYDYIKNFIENRGYEPSYQQIAKHFHIASKSAIAKHIAALEQQKLLTRSRENGSFSLQLASQKRSPNGNSNDAVCEIEWLEIPRDGSEDSEDERLYVPALMLGSTLPEKLRAFRVPNDAMIGKNIREGDIVLIEEKSFPRDGECVAAIIDNKRAVLKNFYRSGANIELRPSNENFEITEMPADQIEIKGIYRGLIRPLL